MNAYARQHPRHQFSGQNHKPLLASLKLVDQAIERTEQEMASPGFMFNPADHRLLSIYKTTAYSEAKRRLQELRSVREVVVFESRQS